MEAEDSVASSSFVASTTTTSGKRKEAPGKEEEKDAEQSVPKRQSSRVKKAKPAQQIAFWLIPGRKCTYVPGHFWPHPATFCLCSAEPVDGHKNRYPNNGKKLDVEWRVVVVVGNLPCYTPQSVLKVQFAPDLTSVFRSVVKPNTDEQEDVVDETTAINTSSKFLCKNAILDGQTPDVHCISCVSSLTPLPLDNFVGAICKHFHQGEEFYSVAKPDQVVRGMLHGNLLFKREHEWFPTSDAPPGYWQCSAVCELACVAAAHRTGVHVGHEWDKIKLDPVKYYLAPWSNPFRLAYSHSLAYFVVRAPDFWKDCPLEEYRQARDKLSVMYRRLLQFGEFQMHIFRAEAWVDHLLAFGGAVKSPFNERALMTREVHQHVAKLIEFATLRKAAHGMQISMEEFMQCLKKRQLRGIYQIPTAGTLSGVEQVVSWAKDCEGYGVLMVSSVAEKLTFRSAGVPPDSIVVAGNSSMYSYNATVLFLWRAEAIVDEWVALAVSRCFPAVQAVVVFANTDSLPAVVPPLGIASFYRWCTLPTSPVKITMVDVPLQFKMIRSNNMDVICRAERVRTLSSAPSLMDLYCAISTNEKLPLLPEVRDATVLRSACDALLKQTEFDPLGYCVMVPNAKLWEELLLEFVHSEPSCIAVSAKGNSRRFLEYFDPSRIPDMLKNPLYENPMRVLSSGSRVSGILERTETNKMEVWFATNSSVLLDDVDFSARRKASVSPALFPSNLLQVDTITPCTAVRQPVDGFDIVFVQCSSRDSYYIRKLLLTVLCLTRKMCVLYCEEGSKAFQELVSSPTVPIAP